MRVAPLSSRPPLRVHARGSTRLCLIAAVAFTLLVASACGGPAAPAAQPLAAAATSAAPTTAETTTAAPTSTAPPVAAPVARQQAPVPPPHPVSPQVRPLVQPQSAPKVEQAPPPAPKAEPKPAPKPEPKPVAKPAPSGGDCDPNYSGCVPIASDVDCAGGSGNGPAYADGPVRVTGSDIYDLDSDDDGTACE
jgi:hypothetical protein